MTALAAPGHTAIRALRVFSVLLVLVGAVVGSSRVASARSVADERPAHRATHNYNAAVAIQFNIYGGLGDATNGYNETVAAATVNSLEGRNPYPFIVSLNEVCQSQYDFMAWVLTADGYGYSSSNAWGYSFAGMLSMGQYFGSYIGNTTLDGDCGTWYGNAIFMRGAFTGGGADWYTSQAPGGYGELRNWICRQPPGGGSVGCSTHLQAGANTYTFNQAAEYRNIATFLSGSGVYAAGDFNFNPTQGALERLAWAGGGFSEADGCCAAQSTTNNLGHLDYMWRRNNGGFAHQAYVFNSSHSDHHWYQGYM